MKFFKYLTAALLPATVFAIPAAEPELKAVSAPATITTEDFHLLMKRQTDLGSIIGDLTDSLGSIKELLSSDSLKNINIVVTQLASLLGDPTTKQIKSLVSTASDLLNSDAASNLLDQLPSLLSSVSGLLNKETLNKITTLLDNAAILLTKEFAQNTKGLINDIAPLVSAVAQVISALLGSLLG
ncbi:hypothetical protein ASPSYDRAFT_34428 [Aspergillus sydowii CBS 593.65]|uniref:Uncharacterized protein n=1 Tax=Aspergillus sydowii CBS 593.65 TaxID=1036612 RepID=A0A1L9T7T1_9EURO|nr:uncharacterized protein ASPSYDRAFT_34428 [Aspergillus sydowii CBS 593.65]OJJ55504.1 hypothetical protein ASPSYDRAFT_34428 [Aspergillus sydowii CBS 593.65]